MSKFITLKMVSSNDRRDRDDHANVHEPDPIQGTGEDDGIEDGASMAAEPPVLPWKPLTISVEAIRNFYPRSGGRPGCRVLMKSGGVAYVVLDEHQDILALING